MEITLECFGVSARLTGGSVHTLTLAAGARVIDALDAIGARWPDLAPLIGRCACAIGDHIAPRVRVLTAGERLALLPPVSAG